MSTTSVPAEGTDVVGEGGENLGPLVVVGEPDIVVEDVETVDGAAAGVEEEEEEEEEEGEDGQEESEDGKEGGAEVGGKEEKEESASEGTEKSKGKEEEKIVPVDLSSADVATAATNGATATTDDSLEREYEGNGEVRLAVCFFDHPHNVSRIQTRKRRKRYWQMKISINSMTRRR